MAGAVDHHLRPTADLLEELVTPKSFATRFEIRVLSQNALLEALELGRRVDAELVTQQSSGPGVRLEGVRLTALTIERDHQQTPDTLAQGFVDQEAFGLGDRQPGLIRREQRKDAGFFSINAQIVQPNSVRG